MDRENPVGGVPENRNDPRGRTEGVGISIAKMAGHNRVVVKRPAVSQKRPFVGVQNEVWGQACQEELLNGVARALGNVDEEHRPFGLRGSGAWAGEPAVAPPRGGIP